MIKMLTHCVKSVQIRSFFWSVFGPNAVKYGPEKTQYFDTFHLVTVVEYLDSKTMICIG